MSQKRVELSTAYAASEDVELNVKVSFRQNSGKLVERDAMLTMYLRALQQATNFCQDAIELEVSIYVRAEFAYQTLLPGLISLTLGWFSQESAWSFIEGIAVKLALLDKPVTMFLESPSLWHYCKTEDELHQYLLPDDEEEEH